MAGDRKKPPLPEEDLALWRHVAGSAKPLPGRASKKKKPAEAAAATPPAKPRARPAEPVPARPELTPGAQADVDKRTADRLKRGKLPIEARLDLHGMTQEQAQDELTGFLARAQSSGKRCVLVITGKGPGREGGVLRRQLPQWLNLPANRARIVAFSSAQPRDGGHGAVYVLLKRLRDG